MRQGRFNQTLTTNYKICRMMHFIFRDEGGGMLNEEEKLAELN